MSKMKTVAQYKECLETIHSALADMLPSYYKPVFEFHEHEFGKEEKIYEMLWHLDYDYRRLQQDVKEWQSIIDDLEEKLDKATKKQFSPWYKSWFK